MYHFVCCHWSSLPTVLLHCFWLQPIVAADITNNQLLFTFVYGTRIHLCKDPSCQKPTNQETNIEANLLLLQNLQRLEWFHLICPRQFRVPRVSFAWWHAASEGSKPVDCDTVRAYPAGYIQIAVSLVVITRKTFNESDIWSVKQILMFNCPI